MTPCLRWAASFLLAGKGGLNLTHSEAAEPFLGRYGERSAQLQPELLTQMQTCRAAVQAMHGGQTVKVAFLTVQGMLVAFS